MTKEEKSMSNFEKLVNDYNVILADEGKGYRLRYDERQFMDETLICFETVLANSNGIKYDDIVIDDAELNKLLHWFASKGVQLNCNNTSQSFWEV